MSMDFQEPRAAEPTFLLWERWRNGGGHERRRGLWRFVGNEATQPGHIITTSAEVTLNGGLARESPQISLIQV